jgi:hypothetical protein
MTTLFIPTIKASVTPMSLRKAAAFAAGLGLSMISYSVNANPSSDGEIVQALYDTLLTHHEERAGARPKRSFRATRAGYSPQLRHPRDDTTVSRLDLGQSN